MNSSDNVSTPSWLDANAQATFKTIIEKTSNNPRERAIVALLSDALSNYSMACEEIKAKGLNRDVIRIKSELGRLITGYLAKLKLNTNPLTKFQKGE